MPSTAMTFGNFLTYGSAAQPPVFSNSFYVDPAGNDTNAGTVIAPFATIAAANTAAIAAVTATGLAQAIRVNPGAYSTGRLRIGNNVSLIGSGQGVTIINGGTGGTGGVGINPGNNSWISDFTYNGNLTHGSFVFCIGAILAASNGDTAATGWTVNNVTINSWSDGFYWKNAAGQFGTITGQCTNCRVNTNFDTVNTLLVATTSTWPLTIEFWNCVFNATWDGSSTNASFFRCLAQTDTNQTANSGISYKAFNCEFNTNVGSGASAIYAASIESSGGGTIEHHGCRFNVTGTATPQYHIFTQNYENGTTNNVVTDGCGYDPALTNIAVFDSFRPTATGQRFVSSSIGGVGNTLSAVVSAGAGAGAGATATLSGNSNDQRFGLSLLCGSTPTGTAAQVAVVSLGVPTLATSLTPVVVSTGGTTVGFNASLTNGTTVAINVNGGIALHASSTYTMQVQIPY